MQAFFCLKQSDITIARGIRNADPGNIDYNKANDWLGQVSFDPLIESRFARFRALGKLLRNYRA